MTRRRRSQALDVQRWRRSIAAPHDHSLAVAHAVMTGRAEDVEPFLAAQKQRPIDGKRQSFDRLAARLASIECFIRIQMTSRDRTLNERSRSPLVLEEVALLQGF